MLFDNSNYFHNINSLHRDILLSRCDGWILVSNILELMCPKNILGFIKDVSMSVHSKKALLLAIPATYSTNLSISLFKLL